MVSCILPHRWGLKLAEMSAVHELVSSMARCIQRFYRGHLARDQARRKRAAYAHFIDLMRVSESRDQEEYFKEMQAMSYAYHQRKEKLAQQMGYRKPRKTVDDLKVEMEAYEKAQEVIRREQVAQKQKEKEMMAPEGFYDDDKSAAVEIAEEIPFRPLTAADLEGRGQSSKVSGLGPGLGEGLGFGDGTGLVGEEQGDGEPIGPGLSSSSGKGDSGKEYNGQEGMVGGDGNGVNPMGAGTIVGDDGMPILPHESATDAGMGIDTIPSPSNDKGKGKGGKDKTKGGVTSILSSLLTRSIPTTTSPPKIHIPFFSKPKDKGLDDDLSNPQEKGESKRNGEEGGGEGENPVPSPDTTPNKK